MDALAPVARPRDTGTSDRDAAKAGGPALGLRKRDLLLDVPEQLDADLRGESRLQSGPTSRCIDFSARIRRGHFLVVDRWLRDRIYIAARRLDQRGDILCTHAGRTS